MKKTIAFIPVIVAMLALTACAGGTAKSADDKPASVQMANPFVECDTMAKAEELAGFTLMAPTKIDTYAQRVIRANEGTMLELIYGDENEIRIRKALGSEDISGDYNTYAQTSTVKQGDIEILMRGADDMVSVATWVSGDESFAIASSKGFTEAALLALIADVR